MNNFFDANPWSQLNVKLFLNFFFQALFTKRSAKYDNVAIYRESRVFWNSSEFFPHNAFFV